MIKQFFGYSKVDGMEIVKQKVWIASKNYIELVVRIQISCGSFN